MGDAGWRANETRNLTGDQIDYEKCTVTVQAGYSKHRETDTTPIRKEPAETLKAHMKGKHPGAKVFGGRHKKLTKRTAAMLKLDLEAACIPYVDDQGRYFDFHSLRHTFR